MGLTSFQQITIPKESNPNLDSSNSIQWKVKSSTMVQKGDVLGILLTDTKSYTNNNNNETSKTDPSPTPTTNTHTIIRAKKRGRKTDIAAAAKALSTAENNDKSANASNQGASATNRKPPVSISRYLQSLSSSSTTTAPVKSKAITSFSSTDRTIRSPISGIITIYTKYLLQNSNKKEQFWVVGKVEPCTHSTVMDGLCVICGKRMNDAQNNNDYHKNNCVEQNENRLPRGELLTVSGGVTVQINNEETRRQMADATLQKLRKDKKLQLVLDIDHTLLHATADPNASYFYSNIPDCKTLLLPIQHPQTMSVTLLRHFVKLRPYICELFLSPEILENYEISIYTAGTRSYAEQVINILCRHFVNYKRTNDKTKEKGCCLGEEQLQQLQQAVQYAKERYELQMQSKKEDERYELSETSMPEKLSSTDNENGTENGDNKLDPDKSAPSNENNQTNEQDTCSRSSSEDASSKAQESEMSSASSEEISCSNGAVSSIDSHDGSTSEKNDEAPNSENTPLKPTLNSKIKGVLKTMKKRKQETDESDDVDTADKTNKKRKRVSFSNTQHVKIISPHKNHDAEETWKQLSKEYKVALELENQAQQLRRQIFGSRIISRTDVGDLGRDVKSLQRVFPCGGKMAVIVDDREDVWANGLQQNQGGEPPPNLLVVKPYHWKPFLGFADVNNAAGIDITRDPNMNNNNEKITQQNNQAIEWNKKTLLEHQKEEEKEIQLKWIKDILIRLHKRFYLPAISERQRDQLTVSSLLKQMRLEVLGSPREKATNVVLSGLVPLHKQQQPQNLSMVRPAVVRYAQDLGATVLPDISKNVTHVIAARDGTDKIKKARDTIPGCAIVRVSWLMDCYWSLSKQDEKSHWLGTFIPHRIKHGKENIKKKVLLIGSDDSEDEDEDEEENDFATEFENDFMQLS